MSLGLAIGLRVVVIGVLAYLYLDSGDPRFLALAVVVGIYAAWTAYRATRDAVR